MLRKINNAYNIFFVFQFLCLVAGILVLLLTPPSGIYVFIIFGQVIATIIFGIIVSNLSDKHLLDKYPSAAIKVSLSVGLTGFRMKGDLDGPLLEKAKLNDDQLAVLILRKKKYLIVFCAFIAFFLGGLASIVFN
ncbi:hypothetical protein [Pseudoflavonifractor phocaeensis]|uniref:hypothetical protein n=1 Tax=Pseudoflavonifractor phocaeensis TaxID=1870988 RepID=UPI001F361244|nr:hypothetical protein [Pseudoflavonifractor phocaeensis]MCF2662499.1 hypothetical protein [Pseudoflavonifractor phocaeensis]